MKTESASKLKKPSELAIIERKLDELATLICVYLKQDEPPWGMNDLRRKVGHKFYEKQRERLKKRVLAKMVASSPAPPSTNIGLTIWLARNMSEEQDVLEDLEKLDGNLKEFLDDLRRRFRKTKRSGAK